MKIIKTIFLLVILFAQTMFAHTNPSRSNTRTSKLTVLSNYVVYTPLSQTVSTNSDTEVSVSVLAQCYGGSSGNVSISPTYVAWDSGLKSITYSGFSGGWLSPGQSSTITFKFKKTVMSNSSFTYKFSTNGSGFQNEADMIKITVNYNYSTSIGCNLSSPSNLSITGITTGSFTYDWDPVVGASYYTIGYSHNQNVIAFINVYGGNTIATVTGLSPNTEYEVAVAGRCSQDRWGPYSYGNVTTLIADCPYNLSTWYVTTGIDKKQASNILIANKKINNGAGAIYHAGTLVSLAPGFNAERGSTFRAYIAGCTNTFVQKKKSSKGEIVASNEEFIDSKDQESYLKLYPNPTTGIFKIALNTKSEGTVTITDMFGKTVYTKEFKEENELEVDIQNQASGIYIVKINTSGQQFIQKIIKQ